MKSGQPFFLSRRRYLAGALGSAVAAACAAPALASIASAAARCDDSRRKYSKSWQPQTTQVEKKS
ncbi:MAG TPA: hypothetical protein VNY82_00280 [Steroidobacteraceae bacterium]|nr:hypothetical protein [Steroidobacteraceae bacterium]